MKTFPPETPRDLVAQIEAKQVLIQWCRTQYAGRKPGRVKAFAAEEEKLQDDLNTLLTQVPSTRATATHPEAATAGAR